MDSKSYHVANNIRIILENVPTTLEIRDSRINVTYNYGGMIFLFLYVFNVFYQDP